MQEKEGTLLLFFFFCSSPPATGTHLCYICTRVEGNRFSLFSLRAQQRTTTHRKHTQEYYIGIKQCRISSVEIKTFFQKSNHSFVLDIIRGSAGIDTGIVVYVHRNIMQCSATYPMHGRKQLYVTPHTYVVGAVLNARFKEYRLLQWAVKKQAILRRVRSQTAWVVVGGQGDSLLLREPRSFSIPPLYREESCRGRSLQLIPNWK